jgi:lipoprotein-anchoring transpeptidase ErfK/SrfK
VKTLSAILLAACLCRALGQEPSPTPAASPEPVAKAGLVDEREIVTRLQIFLDQQNFGPGKIDGRWGEFTGKAVSKYAQCHGLQISANLYDQLPLGSVDPVYTTYRIAPDDLKWIGPTSEKPSEQARLKALLYGDLLTFVCERYHCDPDFLRKINPGTDLEKLKAGDEVRVPNVAPFQIENVKTLGSLPRIPEFLKRSVVVNRKDRMATLYEGEPEGKKILAAFPITPGSDKLPSPPGNWSIVGIASMPTFRWDDGVLNHGVRTDKFFMLPSGPKNPVGVVWIGLSKPGIGMHGTNHPNTIGRAASHGCMRLANWDAVRLAHMVTQKVRVTIE